ncbi:MAG: recombinase family protein [Desulfobacterales bacterium]|nr:recombinase family protein [Desulfobacterales bacterium]MDX2480471.1 recombinase family protein [Desulfuromusa sp.]
MQTLTESNGKVCAHHLQRDAYLYVRQSTMRQIVENQESTKRQYELDRRAVALGWNVEQIHVVDCDLGESGASTTRDGFKFLVSEVGLGRAGIVMGLEVSRLARNSSDWHRLLEICALSHTLILDEEGIYDPAHFNDRLLLGLKGTMSEAELHVIRARLFGGMLNKAKRGELKLRPPVGYIYDVHEKLIKDPDKRVQKAVLLFFETFRRTGTAGGTARAFAKGELRFPRRIFGGPQKGQIVFGELTPARAREILWNPRYAGIYAYGRRQQFHRGMESKPLTKYVEREQWKSFIRDTHPGYISGDEYEENLKRMKENVKATDANRRCPPREGPALLQGLSVCGICGRNMTIRYHKRRGQSASPDYTCCNKKEMVHCQSIPGHDIDKLIGRLLVEKMSRSIIDVAMAVQQELQKRIEETDNIRRAHVESAKYEMECARTRYMMVDPKNRLVADELESDWNKKIRFHQEAQIVYERKREEDQAKITDEQKQKILSLTTDFPRLWGKNTTTDQDRKRMVRLLIDDVTLLKDDQTIKVQIRYKGGACEEHNLARPKSAWEEKRHSPEVLKEIDLLLNDHTDCEVADILNHRGYLSGTGKSFDGRRIAVIRRAYHISSRFTRLRNKGLHTIKEICEKFHVPRQKVYKWRKSGVLAAHRFDDVGRYLYDTSDLVNLTQ